MVTIFSLFSSLVINLSLLFDEIPRQWGKSNCISLGTKVSLVRLGNSRESPSVCLGVGRWVRNKRKLENSWFRGSFEALPISFNLKHLACQSFILWHILLCGFQYLNQIFLKQCHFPHFLPFSSIVL